MQLHVAASLPMQVASILSAKASNLKSETPVVFQNTVTFKPVITTSAYGILLRGSEKL
jgi:hypothetical protein